MRSRGPRNQTWNSSSEDHRILLNFGVFVARDEQARNGVVILVGVITCDGGRGIAATWEAGRFLWLSGHPLMLFPCSVLTTKRIAANLRSARYPRAPSRVKVWVI